MAWRTTPSRAALSLLATAGPLPPLLLLPLLLPAQVAGVSGEPTCYDTWGNEDADLLPCIAQDAGPAADADAPTPTPTWCCRKGDRCLSNGLCLSPGSHNLMTQQGCTDRDWSGPCNRFCRPAGGGNNNNNNKKNSTCSARSP